MDHIELCFGQGMLFRFGMHSKLIDMYTSEETNLSVFRTINTASTMAYRGPLVKVVSLLLRLYENSQLGGPQERELASLLLDAETLHNADLKRLWLILDKSGGRDLKDFIPRALHKLLVSLLCPQSLPETTMSCPTELLLFLTALTESGYLTAASVKGVCCKLQFDFRIIYLHTARLEAKGAEDYEPFRKGGPSELIDYSIG